MPTSARGMTHEAEAAERRHQPRAGFHRLCPGVLSLLADVDVQLLQALAKTKERR